MYHGDQNSKSAAASAGLPAQERMLMPFVSYAQNYEDVILWRALRDVENGFYVDVGAADPVEDSVTRAFYDRGWSGINIEPTEHYYARLVADRPRDLNLRVLAGAQSGVGTIHVIPGIPGLSTMVADFAAQQAEKGRRSTSETLPVVSLDSILHSHGDKPIHFLKIDVEGAERAVLEGTDLLEIRPWIVLVEATEPETQIRTDHLWADLLLDRGYAFAVFDGLNCFYVADEHTELREIIALPPNYFDNFRRVSEQMLLEQFEQASSELQRLASIERTYEALRADRDGLARHAAALEASRGEVMAALEALRASLPDVLNLQADRAGLARHAAALEASRAEVMAARDAAVAEAAQRKLEVAELAAREATLSTALTDARASQVGMAEQLGQLRATVQEIRHDLAGRDMALAELRDETAALNRDLASTTAERLRRREYDSVLERRMGARKIRLFGRLFFRPDGRPVKPLRRLLFHTSGAPRRFLRVLVLHKNGTPRNAFAHWMGSKEYLGLRNAVKPSGHQVAKRSDAATITAPDDHATSPQEQYFLTRPAAAKQFIAPDPRAAEAELRTAALPDGAVAILARLEALSRSDSPAG
jgi:FkbM family methyltransferase